MTDIAVPGTAALSTAPDTAAVCPFLLAGDATWRSSSVSRDHRCHAVAPAAILAGDKQRRLCLVDKHIGCSTYIAATAALIEPGAPATRPLHRSVTKTAPLVLDRARLPIGVPVLPGRGVGQSGLVALMVVAFGALAVTRLGGGGPGIGPVAGVDTGSPAASVVASQAAVGPTAASSPDTEPTHTLVPTEVEPTAAATPAATPVPTVTPGATASTPPTAGPATYTVQSGDTLSGIAGEHGTTWRVLAELNKIDDPRSLRVGQVLKLPG
jgi:LysM repeat protein